MMKPTSHSLYNTRHMLYDVKVTPVPYIIDDIHVPTAECREIISQIQKGNNKHA